ncbi:hypothetical protein ACJ5NV_08160 [Loktanella agnita]|uniref:hypothetical protein n=1 Tax=Loktanella agnita TaxID=287097 RepID=UPI0039874A2D
MICNTIKLAAMACLPSIVAAQEDTTDSFSTAFADAHWGVVVERCPLEADRYAELSDNQIYDAFNQGLDEGTKLERILQNSSVGRTSDLDKYWVSFVVVNASVTLDLLTFGGLFAEKATLEGEAFLTEEAHLRDRAMAAMALTECFWPNEIQRAELADSRWSESLKDVADSVCEIHFFRLIQRYIDAQITELSLGERRAVGAKILLDHEQYLEVSHDPSQCGEFL